MRPVGPDVPAHLQAILREIQDAIRELQNPTKPAQLYRVLLSTDLPPAASYKDCAVLVEGSNTLAISTNVAGTWTWLRADGSAI